MSACLIVKDEEEHLGSCLRSLVGFADEVVVYDTGSTDGTVALATGLGATVLEGYWDDDFSRARNAALAHCRGEWVVWLDADETLQCDDLAGLRDLLLRTKPDIDAWSVPIDNLTGAGVGAGFVHHAARLFRRSRCEWTGRLHEQIAMRQTHTGIRQGLMEMARIRHTGYLDTMMQARNKTERNLRVAEREVAEADGWEKGYSLTSLGRSYLTAGRYEEALDRCAEAAACTDNRITRRLAMRSAAEACIGLGRFDESAGWVDRLRAESTTPTQADAVEVKLALARGDHRRALVLLDALGDEAHDEDGFEYPRAVLAQQRATALAALGRNGEAADLLLAVLGDTGVLDQHLGEVIDHLQRAGRPLSELAQRIPEDRQKLFLAQLLQLRPETADAALDACFAARPAAPAVLAAGGSLARRLPLDRALVWSARLRGAGYLDACPLLAIAGGDRPPAVRATAAATAYRAFTDPRALPLATRAVSAAAPAERAQLVRAVTELCPALAEALRPLAAGDPAAVPA